MNLNTSVYDIADLVEYRSTRIYDTLISRDFMSSYNLTTNIVYVVKEGDRLVDISYKYYNNHNLWFIIAGFNRDKIINPFELVPGTELKIPPLNLLSLI